MSSEDLKPLEEWRALLLFAVVLLFLFGRWPKQGVPYCVFCLFYTYPFSVGACRFVMFQPCNKEEEKQDGLEPITQNRSRLHLAHLQ